MSGDCLRWRERRHSWRHRSEGGFDKSRFEVATIAGDDQPKRFVEQHHYSGTYPAAIHRYGLFEGPRLIGVAILSSPMRAAVLTKVFPALEPYRESLELGRFVLLDAVPANAESWFLARCWEVAAREGVRGVVSFSDPVARARADGALVMPGHIGTIYQATNALYLGRATPRTLHLTSAGLALNDRARSKARAGERGHAYAERQLGAAGEVRRVRHPGNHRYAFSLGKQRTLIALPQLPYPKAGEQP